MPVCVELSSPNGEADELEIVLRAAGFGVVRVEASELGQYGPVSVVDVSAPGSARAVERLRGRSEHAVVRLGDAGSDCEVTRPIRHDALLVALRQALHAAPAAEGDTVVSRTQRMRLEDSAAIEVAAPDTALPEVTGEAPLRPSEALCAELHRAAGPGFERWYARGQLDDALRLAPDALFDPQPAMLPALEASHELTLLELALPQLEESFEAPADGGQAVAVAAAEPRQGHGFLRLDDLGLGHVDVSGQSRSGQLPLLGMVRLLWRISELALDVELDARWEQRRLVARFVAGGLRELWGASHLRAARQLGVVQPAGATEHDAQRALSAAVAAGRMSRFAVDRAVRLADEEQLVSLALSAAASFTLRGLTGSDIQRLSRLPSPLFGSTAALVTRGARRTLGSAELAQLAGGAQLLQLHKDARSRLEQADVEPELRALVLRHEGRSYLDLLAEAADVGAAGVLCVLSVLDAVRFVRVAPESPLS